LRVRDPGRLLARPNTVPGTDEPVPFGAQSLGIGGARDGILYIPRTYERTQPAPLLVLLHGAGGNGRGQSAAFQDLAEAAGLLLLSPDSRARTWDVLMGDYGPDIEYIDRALEQVFDRFNVSPERLAVGGFSDGASYALSLGLTNGDLFLHIVAFSPGFMAPAQARDKPRVYVSHGTADSVLPVERCSRRIVPALQNAGYSVHYHEFEGGHAVPTDIAQEALDWLLER
jgi:phospholipase/carboxylesterase